MVSHKELDNYCNEYLNVDAFKDYCPNGLQIEGAENIKNIVSGVSANLALIERAIDENADAYRSPPLASVEKYPFPMSVPPPPTK